MVATSNTEREGLANKKGIGLPILTPIPAHARPPCLRPFHAHTNYITCSGDVCDKYEVEVPEPVYREPDPSWLSAWHPAVDNGDDTGVVSGDLEEHRHSEVEMGAWRVTPPTIIARKSVVRWAEIGSRYEDRRTAFMAPFWVLAALDFVARTTSQPVVEQRRTQCCRRHSVTLTVQVPIPTRPTHGAGGVTSAVEGGVGSTPCVTLVNTRDSGVDC